MEGQQKLGFERQRDARQSQVLKKNRQEPELSEILALVYDVHWQWNNTEKEFHEELTNQGRNQSEREKQ